MGKLKTLTIKDIHFTYLIYFTNTDLNYCNIKQNLYRHRHIEINQLRYFLNLYSLYLKSSVKQLVSSGAQRGVGAGGVTHHFRSFPAPVMHSRAGSVRGHTHCGHGSTWVYPLVTHHMHALSTQSVFRYSAHGCVGLESH